MLTYDTAKDWVLVNLPEYVPPARTPVGLGAFDSYIFPVVRKVAPDLILNDLVAVQPMAPEPQFIEFYLDIKRDSVELIHPALRKPIFRRGSSVSRAGR